MPLFSSSSVFDPEVGKYSPLAYVYCISLIRVFMYNSFNCFNIGFFSTFHDAKLFKTLKFFQYAVSKSSPSAINKLHRIGLFSCFDPTLTRHVLFLLAFLVLNNEFQENRLHATINWTCIAQYDIPL